MDRMWWTRAGAPLRLLAAGCALLACGGTPVESPEPSRTTQEHAVQRPGGATRWFRQSLGPGFESSRAIAVDPDGNALWAGSYAGGSVVLGGDPLPVPLGLGGSRAFLARYAPDGAHLESLSFGSSVLLEPTSPVASISDIAVDSQGYTLVLASGSLGTDLGAGPMPGGTYLARYSPDGSTQWVRIFYGAFGLGARLAMDSTGDIVLVGSLQAALDLGGGLRASPQPAAFIARYASNGAWKWDRLFSTPDTSHFEDVATDADGDLYVSGFFHGEASFGGGTFTAPAGASAPILAKYSATGAHRWSKSLRGLTGDTEFRGLAVSGRRVFVTGVFSGAVPFAGDTLLSRRVQRGLLLSYKANGSERWGTVLGSLGVDVATGARNQVAVLGFAAPGDELGAAPLPGSASRSLFVAKFTGAKGKPRWVRAFPAEGVLPRVRLAMSHDGECLVSGTRSGPADMGTGPLSSENAAAFLLRLRR